MDVISTQNLLQLLVRLALSAKTVKVVCKARTPERGFVGSGAAGQLNSLVPRQFTRR